MKTSPIPFKPDMINAIIQGRKYQTRRLVKPQPANGWEFETPPVLGTIKGTHRHKGKIGAFIQRETIGGKRETDFIPCPYGGPGDLLWVREAYKACRQMDSTKPRDLTRHEPRIYLADNALYEPTCMMVGAGKYRPSMFMPRALGRITLAITTISLERVQDISAQDAIAEGITEYATASTLREHGMAWGNVPPGTPDDAKYWLADYSPNLPEDADRAITLDPRESFKALWHAVNGTKSWQANPWIWVISFHSLAGNIDDVIQAMGARAA